MTFFWILWCMDALISLIVLYFFLYGLFVDHTVSSFNMSLWFFSVGGLAVIMLGSLLLKEYDFTKVANFLLSLLAIPGFLYGMFMALVFITNPNWR